jgi:hypothetical protein
MSLRIGLVSVIAAAFVSTLFVATQGSATPATAQYGTVHVSLGTYGPARVGHWKPYAGAVHAYNQDGRTFTDQVGPSGSSTWVLPLGTYTMSVVSPPYKAYMRGKPHINEDLCATDTPVVAVPGASSQSVQIQCLER